MKQQANIHSSVGKIKPVLIAGMMLLFGILFLVYTYVTSSISTKPLETVLDKLPSSVQGPYDDMTIPYLRSKKYDGKIIDMKQISSNQNYTSYMATYTSDGLKINGLLTVPNSEKPEKGYPAIVFIHGYIPPSIYQTLSNYASYVDYLARNGFVVFKIDLRGHADSEGEAAGAYYSGDYIVDALNAYNALQTYEKVNKNAVGIWGHSMGGNVTLRALAAKPDIPAAVIWGGAVYTYVDMQKYGIQDNSYRPPTDTNQRLRRRDQLFKAVGQFDPNSDFWKKVAATNYLNDLKGAIQLDHAVNDDVVNIEYSRGLNALLDKTNIPHELHEYPSGGHNISDPSFGPAMQNTVDFFKKYLN